MDPCSVSPSKQVRVGHEPECKSYEQCSGNDTDLKLETFHDLMAFTRRKETIAKLQKFIDEGCGNVRMFHPQMVNQEILDTLNIISDDYLEQILDELFNLFPHLQNGFNISKCMSAVHELLRLFLEQ